MKRRQMLDASLPRIAFRLAAVFAGRLVNGANHELVIITLAAMEVSCVPSEPLLCVSPPPPPSRASDGPGDRSWGMLLS